MASQNAEDSLQERNLNEHVVALQICESSDGATPRVGVQDLKPV
eukprot:CAMPEP_0203747362 /NCGR_PEP_ID=MMETSP0098-20131031/2535_1 /ASSEMBLY_ACC=CAM_ASM_000208 /TAXON_ID=96639 /ORGANISM=" , Strain NY0313808BC1" /LENGTH=43 /DNA_ID= /DNA_START= /DNA_END= /DNA_ORIENTATION=